MSITTIQMLVTIKNATMLNKKFIFISYNKLNHKLIKFLYQEGLLQHYQIETLMHHELRIKVFLRYYLGTSPLKQLIFMSTPKKQKYLSLTELCLLGYNKKILIVSTSKGFLTGTECKRQGVGGKLYFICG